MKRPLIITIGIVIILLVLGLWVYLIVFGTPKSTKDVFTNLGVIPNSETAAVKVVEPQASTSSSTAQLALGGSALQQLTTRTVAGFAFVGSSSATVQYAEEGTGYLYEINLDTGVEKQISLTTLPKTSKVIFSPLGTQAAFISYDKYDQVTSVASMPTEGNTDLVLHELPHNAGNIAFKDENTLYYTMDTGTVTTGYSLNLKSLASTELFSFSAGGVRMQWGNGLSLMYLMTKPSASLTGYIYQVTKTLAIPATDSAPGLTAFMNNAYIITTFASSSRYISESFQNWKYDRQPITMVPEKCAFENGADTLLLCGAPEDATNDQYLEQWYKGEINSNDYLWYVDLQTKRSSLIGDLQKLSGRIIDVTGLTVDQSNKKLLFENKIDGALWLFKLPSAN